MQRIWAVVAVLSFYLPLQWLGFSLPHPEIHSQEAESAMMCTLAFTAPSFVSANDVPCSGGMTDAGFFGGVTGASGAVTYHWENLDIPGTENYTGEGTSVVSGIPQGNYAFIATDAMGCKDTILFMVHEFDPITVSVDVINVTCFGLNNGQLQITGFINSNPPPGYTVYDWNFNGGANEDFGGPAAVDDDAQYISGLSPGTYFLTVTVTDSFSYSCTYLNSYTITQPTLLTVVATDVAIPCFGNTTMISATPSGGTGPYSYNWPSPVADIQTTGPVGIGNYTITITDANGCTATDVANVTQPASAITLTATGSTIACNNNTGTVTANPSGGTPGYTYVWTGGSTANPLTGLNSGTYTVTVTDANGCTQSAQAIVTLTPPTLVLPPPAGSTVTCVSAALVPPIPPPTNNSCGTPETISGPVVSATPACSGTITYTYTYTEPVTMVTGTWVYTYTINYSTTLTPPANGASTVSCPANATNPGAPPNILDACGNSLTPLLIGSTSTPSPVTCNGTVVWTYRYTACNGTTADWTYTYTVTYSGGLTPPANGSSTVSCPATATNPGAPANITDACGRTVVPVLIGSTSTPSPITCNGTVVWTYRYTACDGTTTVDWTYTYTVTLSGALTPPANGSSTISCPANAVNPGAPANITDACGRTVVPVLIGSTSTPSPVTCNGTVVWTYRYTACNGTTTADWTYTYNITYSGGLTPPANGSSTVACPASAVNPGPPANITDACGRTVVPVLIGSTSTPSPVTCNGTVVWTYRYTACDGTTTANWTYTYTVTHSGGITPPANGSSTVSCPVNAVNPGAPANITDACGNIIIPVLIGSTSTPSPITCNGTVVWTYRYTACDGVTADWTYTYTVTYSGGITPPANGSSTVTCPANAVNPGAPANVTDACGRTLVPVLIGSTSTPSPITCNGTVVWTYRYTACDGSTADWTYTYTVTLSGALTPPANGSSTVSCPANAVNPGAPANITDACGRVLTPALIGSTSTPSPITCNGTVVWTYRYTACNGTTADWTYTYTVTLSGALTPPANGTSTVSCPANAVNPGAPANITDACGRVLTPALIGSTSTPSPITCNGSVVWTYRYTACDGTTADWTYTYTVTYSGSLTPPANGSSTVLCASSAVNPGPPANITDACGRTVVPVLIGSTSTPSPITCNGTVVWTYRYTACNGTTTADWTYTYTVTFSGGLTPPANGSSTVSCPANAVNPGAPANVIDACGNVIVPVLIGSTSTPSPITCNGTVVWTYRYTACNGSTSDWTYTYTVTFSGSLTPPANGSSTVSCPANAVNPGAPANITDACGRTVVPVLVGSTSTPSPITCNGTVVWTYRYTACNGTTTADWTYTYTVTLSGSLSPPANGSSTVSCPANAVNPGAPASITDACGRTVVPVLIGSTSTPSPITCNGTVVWTYRYTACNGTTTADWTYTYNVTYSGGLTPPANGSSNVSCASSATDPGPPANITDACGRTVVPVLVGSTSTPSPITCSGTVVWTYRYTACDGTTTANWTYTYTVSNSGGITPPANGSSTVSCPANAVNPGPPANVTDACGNIIVPVLIGSTSTPSPITCNGTVVWTYRYTACDGTTSDWTYTYTVTYSGGITPPANGSSTVSCPANATNPGAPANITDACGRTIVPVLIGSTSTPSPITCNGTVVWTYRYTACNGTTADWTYTYTVTLSGALTPPANGSSTVACPANAVNPGAPANITDACGRILTPVLIGSTSTPSPITCNGTVVWTYRYTACNGTTVDWTYTYTVTLTGALTPPANGSSTASCPANAVNPGAPANITDACGNIIVPALIGSTSTPSPITCNGTVVWTYRYTACNGTTADWTYTYTVTLSGALTPPANGSSTVLCASNAVNPGPPANITDACGRIVVPVLIGSTSNPSPIICNGTVVWTYRYTACDGTTTADWTYTYTVTFSGGLTPPANGSSTVSCPANAVNPGPPANVTDACGNIIVPVLIGSTSTPSPITCNGTVVWTYRYTACNGSTSDWTYTYTVTFSGALTPPANGSSTVSCPANATNPGAPANITDACGRTIVPVLIGSTSTPSPITCNGTVVWTYRYTACDGTTTDWTYTYTVTLSGALTPPANGSSTVACPANATNPGAPANITDACGRTVVPVLIGSTSTPSPITCNGTVVWTYRYAACDGTTADWTYTFNVTYSGALTPPANGSSTVSCAFNATDPGPPANITDACGRIVSPVLVGSTSTPSPIICNGTVVWTYRYTACDGTTTANWTYTYTVTNSGGVTPPANGASTVSCPANAVNPGPPANVTDACGNIIVPVLIGSTSTPSPITCNGTVVWTYRYTACDGTTSDWTYTYTVTFSGGLTPPANGSSTVSCPANATNPGVPANITDACGRTIVPVLIGSTSTPSPITCNGTVVWTYRYTACDGTTADWTYTYTVTFSGGLTPPANGSSTVSCPGNAVNPGAPANITDACGRILIPALIGSTSTPSPITCNGSVVWTYRYTACDGTTADWTYTYTVTFSGSLTPPANGSSTVACPANAVDPGPPANITDACGRTVTPVLVGSTSTPSPVTCNGTIVWTYRYTACNGTTTADWTYTYTITHSGALTPPANGSSTVSCPANAVNPGAPANITDACGNVITPVLIGSTSTPSPVTCNGTVVWTYRYTACDGMTVDWTYTYTITYSSTLTPPANGSSNVACPANAVNPGAPANVTDACGNVIVPVLIGSTSTPSPITCNGTVVWTYRYTACNGTTADWTYTYTVTLSGSLTPPANGSSTVSCPANAVNPGAPANITDACGRTIVPALIGSTSTPSPITCNGTVVWTYRYTACDGTTADWTYTYTVTLSGALTPPANGSSTVSCPANAVNPGAPANITDACGRILTPALIGSTSTPSPITCNGTVVWTYRYTACDGTTADWTYTYTVTFSGTLTPPANGSSTVACPANAIDPGPPANITDACGRTVTPVLIGSTSTPSPVTCNGTIVWTYRYTACNGTTADWTYTYTITHSGALTPPANGSSTVACPVNAVNPGAPANITDACGNVITPVLIGSTSTPSPVICNGTIVWTYRYTACDGMTVDWTYTYTITYSGTITPPANGSSNVACPANAVNPGAPANVTDACGNVLTPALIGSTSTPSPITCNGTVVWTYRYTACDGTTADWTYTYTVTLSGSLTPPANSSSTISCPANAVNPGAPANITDACGRTIVPALIGSTSTPSPITCNGTVVWTYRYTACDGTTADWTYTYTVTLSGALTPPANGSSTVACPANAVNPGAPANITDACGRILVPALIGSTSTPSPITCNGTVVWTYRYTACDGTTADWTYTYTVTFSGTLTPPSNGSSTVACPANAIDPGPPANITDACGRTVTPVLVGSTSTPSPVTCNGTVVWTYRYTACNGTTTADWTYTYTITHSGALTPPANGSSTVSCPANAVNPGAPTNVTDACGNVITPVLIGSTSTPSPVTCNGTVVWTYRYTTCDGMTADWTYTYTITYSSSLTPPANGSSNVACSLNAVDPGAPANVTDACGNAIVPVLIGSTSTPSPITCNGTVVWTYRYTACDGTTADWTYTYTVTLSGSLTPPASGSSTVSCPANAVNPGAPANITDACGNVITPVLIGSTSTPSPITCNGTVVWTYRYTACDGTTADWTYTYTVTYSGTLTPPADGSSTVSCPTNAVNPGAPANITDACGNTITPVLIGSTSTPSPITCNGTVVWTYRYTACDGTTADWTYTYTVTLSGTLTPPANGSSTVSCLSNATDPGAPANITDACGRTVIPVLIGSTSTPSPITCNGTVVWTYRYTACDGTTTTDWTYTYTVIAPSFTVPAPGSSTVACAANATSPTPPVVIDNCGNTIPTPVGVASADPPCAGTKTWTFTYLDCSGTPMDWVYTYTISPPIVTMPAGGSSNVACIADAVLPVPPVVMDNCNRTLSISVGVPGTDPICVGPKTWTFTYTACDGTTYPWVYTYTIDPPTTSFPPDDGSIVACISDAQVVPTPPTAVNSCGDPLTVTGPVIAPDPLCSGTKTYTWTYTDCTGTSSQWVYTYTISPSTFTLPANAGSVVACIADAQVTPSNPTANSVCGDPLTVTGPVIGADPVCSGTKTYTWTYMDCSGNMAQWVFTYTILPPTFSLPPDDGSAVTCVTDAQVVPVPPVVNNSCGDPITPSGPAISPDPGCTGTKTYTWTYLDCSGISLQWVYTYTINAPVIVLPPNDGSSVPCLSNAQVVPVPPTVNNSCSNPVVPTGPVISPDPVCAGTKTYTWTYADCNGGSVDWVYTYTIPASTFTLPPNDGSTVTCISDAQVAPSPPTVSNTCGSLVVPTGPVISADPVCSGTKTYTWTYTNCDGTNINWIFTYTITGNTGPVFANPPANVTVSCIADVPSSIMLSFTDDCTPSTPVAGVDSPVSGSCPATVTRTWSFTDDCGFTGTASQIITIDDTTPPTASNPAPLTLAGCNTTVPAPDATVVTDEADNCLAPVVAFINDVTSLVGCTETTIRNYSVTDACNNSIVVSQTITRTLDTQPPVISPAPADLTVDCLTQVPPMPSLTFTDNCSPGGTIIGTQTGPSGNPLTIIRTWTFTDACGNPATQTQTITINGSLIGDVASADFCAGGSVVVYGQTYNTAGTFLDTIPSTTGGCDTLLTITITQLPLSVTNLTDSFCNGDTYLLPDGSSTTSGGPFGPFHFTAANGCDSSVNIVLTQYAGSTGNVNHNGCEGDNYSVVVNGTTYDEFNKIGTETLIGANIHGCDSIVDINLVFNANVTGDENYTGCTGDGYSVIVNGTLYDEANPTGMETLLSSTGCDSIVTIDLIFNQVQPVQIDPQGPVCLTGGVVTLTASVGSGTWSGSVSSSQFDPLALGIGSHQVIYTISQGACSDADTIQVVVYQVSLSCQAITDESAPGANDGEGMVTITGGIAPYLIQWTGPVSGSFNLPADGDHTISNLGGGVYTIVVEDASGCTVTCQFLIMSNIPCLVVIDNVNIQDASCVGANNGAISVNASGGSIPYEYSLDGVNFQMLNVFANLSPGNYTVFVRDITGCTVPQNFTIGVGPGPTINVDGTTNASCGLSNGSVTLSGLNGQVPYMFSIDGINYTFSGVFPGLSSGNFSGYLTDNVGCSDTISFSIVADGAPVINNVILDDAGCGQSNGAITIQASGGQGILMYSIDGVNFQTSPVFNGLLAGSYTIVVTDESGCSVTQNVAIQNANGPTISTTTVDATCGNSDGKITITGTGALPVTFSINGINYFSSGMFMNLPAGNYTAYIKDGNNCVTSQPVSLNTTNGPIINSIVVVDTHCGDDDGEITINASGGVGDLEYIINFISYGDENHTEDWPAGIYDIVVQDENGCSVQAQVTIDPSVKPDFDVIIDPAHCDRPDGVVTLDGTDGTPPFMYSFNGGPFGPIFQFPGHISDFYTVAIKDAKGCITEKDIFLFEDIKPNITLVTTTDATCGMADGTITVTATGILPLEYSKALPFYQSSNFFSPVAPGTYTITVKDQFGCTDTATATIAPKPQPVINNLQIVNSDCGANNGKITILANGGVAPLMYALNSGPFGSSNMFSGLAPGSYTLKVKGANGCEIAQDTVILSIGAHTSAVTGAFCVGDTYQIAGNTYTLPGNYTITLPGGASNGCDSVINLTLSQNLLIPKNLPVSICANEVYTINGTDYSIAGSYLIDTIPAAVGCDTIRTLVLTVNPLKTKTLFVTICANEVYTINGIDYNAPGQYLIDTVNAATGCDTIRTLDLTVNPLEAKVLDVSICNGATYTIGGMTYSVQGQYVVDTISAASGCDSIRTLNLTVDDYIHSDIIASICNGDVYTINGVDYTIAGQFVIDTIIVPANCDTIRTLNLTVNPLPQANAGNDQVLDCTVQSLVLNGTATGGTPHWTGPDINATNENQLTPTVTLPGTYYLTVTSANNCTAIDSALITLDPSTVIATAAVDTFLSCDIDTVVLQAGPLGPNLIYQWSGPGINASNEHLVNPIVTVAGTYSLVVTNTLTNCVSLPANVTVLDMTRNIVAIIQAPGSLTCFSTIIDLNATGSTTGPNIVYIWFNENGFIDSTSLFLQVTSGGMFTFHVIDTISGCFDDTTVFVKDLQAYPPVDAGLPQQLDCNHSTVILNEGAVNNVPNVIFHWDGPPGGILTSPTLLSVTAGAGGEYFITATDTITGCVNSDSVIVTDLSQLPFIEIQLVQQFTCLDSTAMINIGNSATGPGISYEWNGPQVTAVTSTFLEPTLPGWYYLTVTNTATGCLAIDSILLELPEAPTGVQVNVSIPLCEGDFSGSLMVDTVTGGTPVYTYSIDGLPLQTSPLFDDLMAGNYSLVVVDANGCSFQQSFTIPDGEKLTINIGGDIELELGDSIQLSATINIPWSQIDSIVWASPQHLSCTYCIDPILQGLLNEIITATVYAGGCVDSDALSLRVDVDANVYIPNVFSPNHDGINDAVTVFADHRVKKVVYLEIFDRWGNQVFVNTNFDPNDPSKGWDGTFKDKPMNPAVFAYVAKVELINGVQIPFKGDITLLR